MQANSKRKIFFEIKTDQRPLTNLLNAHTSTNIRLFDAASVTTFKKILEEEVTVFWILKIHMGVTYIYTELILTYNVQ